MVGRVLTYAFIIAVVVACLYPLAWNPRTEDSFPLSNFPMFSRGQKTPVITVRYAVAVEADGGRRSVPPLMVANREVLQSRATILRALRGGARGRDKLCKHIASNVAAAGHSWASVTEIRIVSGRHDAVEYLTGRDRVGIEKVHAKCGVAR